MERVCAFVILSLSKGVQGGVIKPTQLPLFTATKKTGVAAACAKALEAAGLSAHTPAGLRLEGRYPLQSLTRKNLNHDLSD
ncbi:MAG: hypothetical protein ACTHNW_05210 [Mucilaginibacter sp.]